MGPGNRNPTSSSPGQALHLPLEVWDQILRHHVDFTEEELKTLCSVGSTFKQICQASLFRVLSVSPKVLMSYREVHTRVPSPVQLYTSTQRRERLETIRRSHISSYTGNPLPRRPQAKWEEDMLRTVESTHRLLAVGDHKSLRRLPRCLKIEGYDVSVGSQGTWDRFDSFQPPSQQATRFVYDALVRFRVTLAQSLRQFEGLQMVELVGCPIDKILLEAIASHHKIRGIVFKRCWFLSSPTPLASIYSMTFHQIPAKHLTHAYRLISPAHIGSLEVLGWDEGSQVAFEEFCAGTVVPGKAKFPELQDLALHFRSDDSKPITCLRKFLTWTPTLLTLAVKGQYSGFTGDLEGTFPVSHIPNLRSLSGSLQMSHAIVPGRPIERLCVEVGSRARHHQFIAADEHELEALLHPLTLSTATITSLTLLSGRPLAPVWQVIPCIAAMFPELRELQCTVSGANGHQRCLSQDTALRHGSRSPSNTTALSPFETKFLIADGHDYPHIKPECLQDVLYFLARGYYRLPRTLQRLTVTPYFGGAPSIVFESYGERELFMQGILEGIAEMCPDLSEVNCGMDFSRLAFSYHKIRREGSRQWQKQ